MAEQIKKDVVAVQLDELALHKVGLHHQTIDALEAMATTGITLRCAAKEYKVDKSTLQRALRRPRVKRAYDQVIKHIQQNAGMQAFLRINHMGQEANSENVKLDANKFIAGVAGISPIKKVEGHHTHNVKFGGFVFDDDEPLDVTPENSQSPAGDG